MKNKNINWELGRGYDLRAASSGWVKSGVRELKLFLAGAGPRGGGPPSSAPSLAELRQAELCLRVFEAELFRRGELACVEAGGLFGVQNENGLF
jgi:hypothetical protein